MVTARLLWWLSPHPWPVKRRSQLLTWRRGCPQLSGPRRLMTLTWPGKDTPPPVMRPPLTPLPDIVPLHLLALRFKVHASRGCVWCTVFLTIYFPSFVRRCIRKNRKKIDFAPLHFIHAIYFWFCIDCNLFCDGIIRLPALWSFASACLYYWIMSIAFKSGTCQASVNGC